MNSQSAKLPRARSLWPLALRSARTPAPAKFAFRAAHAASPLHALAAEAGFRFNGDAPWDIRVADPRFYRRVEMDGSLGFGEAYMDGWWECERLDQLFHRLLAIDADRHIDHWARLRLLGAILRHALFNPQASRHAFVVGERLLDIGSGWGGLARFAARHYGVEVLGITVSKEQQKLARERCAGWPVSIELMDYRELSGQFDKVVSVGMFEHVGPKNHPAFFAIIQRLLKDHGLFLLQTIGNHETSRKLDPWVDKYVFPNGRLPSAAELAGVVEGRFLIEDWHNFGADYDRTLMAWWENFERGWPGLADKYGRRFYRMWKYYLLSCAGFFRARQGQLWQVVLSKRTRAGIYRSVR